MKLLQKIMVTVFILIVSVQFVFANGGNIKGIVLDSSTLKTMKGAVIKIEATTRGAYVDKNGEFSIISLPKGTYTITVTHIGYYTTKQIVLIQDNDTLNIEIYLQAKEIQSKTIVVSANKHSQAVQDVPVSISTLDSKDLQTRNITRIDDALRYIPGVNLARDQVSIRGSSGFALGLGSRVSLLLDGFPMISADNGDIKFDAIPLLNIDKVEVLKGAGSALYGTAALGGVVSIFTKDATAKPEFKIRTSGGFFTNPKFLSWKVFDTYPENYTVDLSYSKKIGLLGVTIAGGTRYDLSYRLFDDSRKWNFYSKLSYDVSSKTKVTAFVNYATEDHANWVFWNSLDSATRPPTGTNFNERVISNKLATSFEVKHFFRNTSFLVIRSGIYSTDFHNLGLASGILAINSKATSFNSEAQFSTQIERSMFLTSGINATINSVESPIYGSPLQSIFSGYSQVEYSGIEKLILTLGSRVDVEKTDSSKRSIQVNPKFGLSYTSNFDIQFRASIGRGFRAPMAGERFAAIRFQGITVVPNLSLIPEESWSLEGGFNHDFKFFESPCSIDLAYFQNEYYQMVEPQFTIDGKIRFENITRARVQGIECTFKTFLANLIGIETSLTAMDPRIYNIGVTLPFRSSILWYSKLLLPIFDGVEFQTDYRFISRVERIDDRIVALKVVEDADARVATHVLDARVILNFSTYNDLPIICTLNVKNVLDYYYVEILGNLAPTRTISLQIDAKF